MNTDDLRRLLEQFQQGESSLDETLARLRRTAPTPDAHVDIDRLGRCGFPEVVYCEGKTPAAVVGIFEELLAHTQSCLGTRADEQHAQAVRARFPQAQHNVTARTLYVPGPNEHAIAGRVAVISAGTSDRPVAEEALETLRWMRVETRFVQDVGVAGPHRLVEQSEHFQDADAVVVVAGMEGALPSIVGGHVDCPVIAVPTSVGYGASFGGVAALLGMLNSCAANVSVVNIDAGFKAAYVAGTIARRTAR
ncbi:MAG: 1-(5-phosphoribosyl)-5-amino-4-imidazole-carboxylate carboxylase [Planctomycetaceae bacterium]|nr:1-(5-phosphoribosyl)-5-amino-4-imidazole-carboxylate carboxylase [Planctomycetaceae bacterium]